MSRNEKLIKDIADLDGHLNRVTGQEVFHPEVIKILNENLKDEEKKSATH